MIKKDILETVLKEQDGLCCFCKRKIIISEDREFLLQAPNKKISRNQRRRRSINATIEHIIPKSKGGYTRDIRNIKVSCFQCNHFRGNIHFDIFSYIRKKENWKEFLKLYHKIL